MLISGNSGALFRYFYCIIYSIEDFHEIDHLLEADRVTAVDGLQAQAAGDHRFAKAGRAGEDKVAEVVEPEQILSRGGKDSTDNTVALCPNCHTKMHVVDDSVDVQLLKDVIAKMMQ